MAPAMAKIMEQLRGIDKREEKIFKHLGQFRQHHAEKTVRKVVKQELDKQDSVDAASLQREALASVRNVLHPERAGSGAGHLRATDRSTPLADGALQAGHDEMRFAEAPTPHWFAGDLESSSTKLDKRPTVNEEPRKEEYYKVDPTKSSTPVVHPVSDEFKPPGQPMLPSWAPDGDPGAPPEQGVRAPDEVEKGGERAQAAAEKRAEEEEPRQVLEPRHTPPPQLGLKAAGAEPADEERGAAESAAAAANECEDPPKPPVEAGDDGSTVDKGIGALDSMFFRQHGAAMQRLDSSAVERDMRWSRERAKAARDCIGAAARTDAKASEVAAAARSAAANTAQGAVGAGTSHSGSQAELGKVASRGPPPGTKTLPPDEVP